MADYQLIIIGGGLSAVAAGIRAARFGRKTLILEQHTVPGGLNSFYFRRGILFETGLHAMTNFASIHDKHAPLNRLFRQLKLSRRQFLTHEQLGSEIVYPDCSLQFTNTIGVLAAEIGREFPGKMDSFARLVGLVEGYDPFKPAPWRSTRAWLAEVLSEPLLEEMLLLPLMVYGNAEEHDMDLGQFVIMFRAVFLEGFFRPAGTIRDFLELLFDQYKAFDGEIRFASPVEKILSAGRHVQGVMLASGEEITAEAVLSTVGIPGTALLADWSLPVEEYTGHMSFMETITLVPQERKNAIRTDRTIIFYNQHNSLPYHRPQSLIDTSWGVICLPDSFQGMEAKEHFQVRVTNAANYTLWQELADDEYEKCKQEWTTRSCEAAGKIIGNYWQDIVYQDSFTPLTIERYTGKAEGAVYGSPRKIKDGLTPWENLFLAGTDQGYLGIVGSMLSGVTIVNQHLLSS